MTVHRERGALLMQQGRLDQAVEEFGRALVDDPTDAVSHGCMALCLCKIDRLDEAEAAAKEAIRHGPDDSLGHFALATIYLERNRLPEAHRAAAEAIRIDPRDPDNFALMAGVLVARERWDHARQVAEAGLEADPENVQCLNLRALALQQLGRGGDAREVLAAALARDPDNAGTHATAGWSALRGGDSRTALEHFKEALRIDPTLDHARAGIVEALKARNVFYALMLRYFFWMTRLSPRGRWMAIIGGYVGYRVLRQIAKSNPEWAPWIWPLMAVYILFVFLTWTAEPLSNLLLRVHPLGRLALSREQVVASNWLGLVLLGAGAAGAWWLVTGEVAAAAATLGGLGLSIPVAATFSCEPGWPRRAASLFTAALAAIGVAALAFVVAGGAGGRRLAGLLAIPFIIGIAVAPWLANILIAVKPRR